MSRPRLPADVSAHATIVRRAEVVQRCTIFVYSHTQLNICAIHASVVTEHQLTEWIQPRCKSRIAGSPHLTTTQRRNSDRARRLAQYRMLRLPSRRSAIVARRPLRAQAASADPLLPKELHRLGSRSIKFRSLFGVEESSVAIKVGRLDCDRVDLRCVNESHGRLLNALVTTLVCTTREGWLFLPVARGFNKNWNFRCFSMRTAMMILSQGRPRPHADRTGKDFAKT